jgi:predicted CXXCH cytochrome family protein
MDDFGVECSKCHREIDPHEEPVFCADNRFFCAGCKEVG